MAGLGEEAGEAETSRRTRTPGHESQRAKITARLQEYSESSSASDASPVREASPHLSDGMDCFL